MSLKKVLDVPGGIIFSGKLSDLGNPEALIEKIIQSIMEANQDTPIAEQIKATGQDLIAYHENGWSSSALVTEHFMLESGVSIDLYYDPREIEVPVDDLRGQPYDELLDRMESIGQQLKGDADEKTLRAQIIEDPNMRIAAILKGSIGDKMLVTVMWQNGKAISKSCGCGVGNRIELAKLIGGATKDLIKAWEAMHAEPVVKADAVGTTGEYSDDLDMVLLQKILEDRRQ